jgi:hypothetical protein
MAKTSKREELIAHAIWHTPSMPIYDKRELAVQLASVMGVNDVDDFVRLASDPAYGPTGPALLPSEPLMKAAENNAKGESVKNWEVTPEGSGPVVPPGDPSRKKSGPTPDPDVAQEKAANR